MVHEYRSSDDQAMSNVSIHIVEALASAVPSLKSRGVGSSSAAQIEACTGFFSYANV